MTPQERGGATGTNHAKACEGHIGSSPGLSKGQCYVGTRHRHLPLREICSPGLKAQLPFKAQLPLSTEGLKTPSAFRPTPSLGSPPGLGTRGNRPYSCGTQDTQRLRTGPLCLVLSLRSHHPPRRRRTPERLKVRCSRRRRGGPRCARRPAGRLTWGVRSSGAGTSRVAAYAEGAWLTRHPQAPRIRLRQACISAAGSVAVRGGAPGWGLCLEEFRPRSPDLALPFAGGCGILPSEVRPFAWCS